MPIGADSAKVRKRRSLSFRARACARASVTSCTVPKTSSGRPSASVPTSPSSHTSRGRPPGRTVRSSISKGWSVAKLCSTAARQRATSSGVNSDCIAVIEGAVSHGRPKIVQTSGDQRASSRRTSCDHVPMRAMACARCRSRCASSSLSARRCSVVTSRAAPSERNGVPSPARYVRPCNSTHRSSPVFARRTRTRDHHPPPPASAAAARASAAARSSGCSTVRNVSRSTTPDGRP